ncbi:MAG: hypothetical protein ABI408_05670 [Gemmatimonadaceae bacterium]
MATHADVRRIALALWVATGISCDHLTDPTLPPDAQLFAPLAVYDRWWAMVESCSGITRPLADVQWFATKTDLLNPSNDTEHLEGYYSLAGNRIVIRASDTLDGTGVRHEMLHALLRIAGHPRSAFLERCGGVVSCQEACVQDAGPAAPAPIGTPTVAPSALQITSVVSPAAPSMSNENGMFTFTIMVRNPFPYSVVAVLPARAAGGKLVGYDFDIRSTAGDGVIGSDPVFDDGLTYFQAGEIKRDVFDFAVAPSGFITFYGFPGLPQSGIAFYPATFNFAGSFGRGSAPILSVVLSP